MSNWIASEATSKRVWGLSAVASVCLLLTACADMMQPGFYDPPKASSATDAEQFASNSYAIQNLRAPSQIEIDLRKPSLDNQIPVPAPNSTAAANAPQVYKAPPPANASEGAKPSAALPSDVPPPVVENSANAEVAASGGPSPQAALIPEPMSFAGTVPCFNPNMDCNAQRVVLSLAPNGRWRSRATFLDQNQQNGKPLVEQGCWRTVLGSYKKISVLSAQGIPRAEFAVPSDNLLAVLSVNGQTPNLRYTLSRQPDLDPIAELDKTAAPNCN